MERPTTYVLTSEYNKLLSKYNELIVERNILNKANSSNVKEHNKLVENYNSLTRNIKQLTNSYKSYVSNHNTESVDVRELVLENHLKQQIIEKQNKLIKLYQKEEPEKESHFEKPEEVKPIIHRKRVFQKIDKSIGDIDYEIKELRRM